MQGTAFNILFCYTTNNVTFDTVPQIRNDVIGYLTP